MEISHYTPASFSSQFHEPVVGLADENQVSSPMPSVTMFPVMMPRRLSFHRIMAIIGMFGRSFDDVIVVGFLDLLSACGCEGVGGDQQDAHQDSLEMSPGK